ncbi:hypothetical protein Pcinc_028581 [Petrolisthes cinctipes]|uniref:CRAL-TRIO domain-containing protein n=1 Tax=Petrolisthes cinctipes TaxID=88211 RepID=A0AAE1K711_PETCI|nr:hypothetical protein Pcinc_028581 [Petrolisthes cinctipes]
MASEAVAQELLSATAIIATITTIVIVTHPWSHYKSLKKVSVDIKIFWVHCAFLIHCYIISIRLGVDWVPEEVEGVALLAEVEGVALLAEVDRVALLAEVDWVAAVAVVGGVAVAILPLPGTDYKGRKVVLTRAGLNDPNEISLQELVAGVLMVTDVFFDEEEVASVTGVVVVEDVRQITMTHMVALTPVYAKKMSTLLQVTVGRRGEVASGF